MGFFQSVGSAGSPLGRTDDTPMVVNQAADHNKFAQLIDALRAAGVSLEALAPLPALFEAYGGLTVPARSLEHWQADNAPLQVVLGIGDSTHEGFGRTADVSTNREIGWETWDAKMARLLSRQRGFIVHPGASPMWRDQSVSVALGIGSWSKTGTWTQIATTDAFNVAPFR